MPPALGKTQILHEGAIGTFSKGDGFATTQLKYKDWAKKPREEFDIDRRLAGHHRQILDGGPDPAPDRDHPGRVRVTDAARYDIHEARMLGEARTINPGRQITETQHLFAGAKRNEILLGLREGARTCRASSTRSTGASCSS